MTDKTGREACDEGLQPFVDKFAEKPFVFKDESAIRRHRSDMNKTDTVESVQEGYHKYVDGRHKLIHKVHEVNSGNVAPFKLSIFTPDKPAPTGGRPCLYFIHGGGLVTNNAFSGIHSIFHCIDTLNAVCVSIDYSLAPDLKAPTQVKQCYEGLEEIWNKYNNSNEINFDKLAVIGRSAGATLLVGLNIKMRGHPHIKIRCNIMSFPILDNGCDTQSHQDFCDAPHLPSRTVILCWSHYLRGGEVSGLTVPALSTIEELQDFPPTFIEKGNADVLSVEAENFQRKLSSAGVDAPIRHYAGFHCFDGTSTDIARRIKQDRLEFLRNQME